MPPEIAQAVAVALHELATTAAKYGALSVAGGHVQVECCACQMEASSSAGRRRAARPSSRQCVGASAPRVMDNMIRGQLKGEMRFDWRAEGLACQIVLPV